MPTARSVLAASSLGIAAVALGLGASPAVAVTCADFPNQAAAQAAANTADPDGDGIYCESLPCPCAGPASGGGSSGGTTSTPARSKKGKYTRLPVRITRVVDGDTLKARTTKKPYRNITIRLIGIDTPETKKPGVGVECGGKQATAYMTRLALQKRGTLIADSTQDYVDHYKRTLGYLQVGKRDVGRSMVSAGWADVYVYDGTPFRRYSAYEASKASASAAGKGVFGACAGDFHSGQ